MTGVLPLVIHSFGLDYFLFLLSGGGKEQALSGRNYKITRPFRQDGLLAREPQCVDNGDGELGRWNGTKENEALFTAPA